MRVRVGVLLAAVCGVLSFGAAPASAAALEPCKRADSGRTCATLTVPLDRSGAVPGTVKLRIERQKAKRAVRPPLFLLAGGPGQSATEAFDSETVEETFGTEARSRDIVVVDLRGTGRSGALNCPALQRGSERADDIAACATQLGARRDFYSSMDLADDIEAVRAALGAEQLSLYGVSYGTYVAQIYARRYPTRVERLLLDSIVGPDGVDPLGRASMAAVPAAVEMLCGNRLCRRFTRSAGEDVVRLAERLQRRPLTGFVTDRHGRSQRANIDAGGLLRLAWASDLNPMVTAELPAAVRAALDGDPALLLRIQTYESLLDVAATLPRELSVAANAATLCADTRLPWDASTPVAARQASVAALVNGLPAAVFAPFGRQAALENEVLEICRAWPGRAAAPLPTLGPLPQVPALLIAGGLDIRTPVAGARSLAAQLPGSELMVLRSGHGALSGTMDGCAGKAVRRFLAGGRPGSCGLGRSLAGGAVLPSPPPTSLRHLRVAGARGRAGKTVSAVRLTVVDGLRQIVSATLLEALRAESFKLVTPPKVGALRGGSYVGTKRGFELRRASLVPGVRVSGAVWVDDDFSLRGKLKVAGPAAERGRFALRPGLLSGTVGGQRVRVGFSFIKKAFGIPSRASLARAQAARALTGAR